MIFALNAAPVWVPVVALAVIGVLALIGAAVCLVLIIKHKKEDGIAAAEDAPAAQPLLPFNEEKVEEEISEPASEPVAEEEAVEEEIAEEVTEEPVEEVAEEPIPEPVEEAAEESIPEPVEEVVEEAPEEEAPAEPDPVPEEAIEEPAAEIVEEPAPEPVTEEKVKPAPIIERRVVPEGKVLIKVRYNRSYTAKLIQSNDTVKDYYTIIKNELMRYKVHDRKSWKYETFRSGRKLLVKLAVRGKSLYVYFALNPADYADTKYKINDVSHMTSNAAVPTLYKIKNDRRCRYAKQLIADVMAANGLEAGAEQNENYAAQYPYEELEPLIERKLVKILKWEERATDAEEGFIAVSEEIAEEIAATAVQEAPEETVEEVIEEVTEEPVEEVIAEEPEEEISEEPEPVEEEEEAFEEEVAVEPEPVKEEEEIPEEPEPVPEPEEPAGITVAEAEEQISDEEAESYVQVSEKYSDKTKKAVINIDTLGRYFGEGETVTLEEVKKRIPDIGKKVTYIKVLARGKLDKALNVEADDFSPAAIKMIVLMGGSVIRKTTNIN